MQTLHLEQPGTVLPARIPCASCQAEAVAVGHPQGFGTLFHCPACGIAGDMVDYLATHLARDTIDVATWIAEQEGWPGPASAFRLPGQRRGLVAALLRKAAGNMAAGPSPAIIRLLAINKAYPFPHSGFARLLFPTSLGWASRGDLRDLTDRGGFVVDRPAACGTWHDSLVCGHELVPGWWCGAQIVSYLARPDKDHSFIGAVGDREAGLFGLSQATSKRQGIADRVIAYGDPLAVIRSQIIHGLYHSWPAPYVAWYAGASRWTESAWASLAGRRVLLVAESLSPAVLLQAMLTDATVLLTDGSPVRASRVIARGFEDLWKYGMRTGTPWKSALRAKAKSEGGNWVARLLRDLSAYGHDRAGQARDALAGTKAAIGPVAGLYRKPIIRLGSHDVMLKDRRWWIATAATAKRQRGPFKLWTDATLRIRIVRHWENQVVYDGVVGYAGREIPFQESMDVVEADPAAFIRRVVVGAGYGRPTVSSLRLPFTYLDAAFAFHPVRRASSTRSA